VTAPEPRPAGAPGTDPLSTDPLSTSLGGAPSGRPAGSSGPLAAGGPAAPAPGAGTTKPARSTGRTIGRTLALALLLFVTVLLVLFVVFNTQTVDISLVFTDVQAPLVLALLIAAALGGLLVALAGTVARARRRNR
jgi:uncharacterized integral membrane protein